MSSLMINACCVLFCVFQGLSIFSDVPPPFALPPLAPEPLDSLNKCGASLTRPLNHSATVMYFSVASEIHFEPSGQRATTWPFSPSEKILFPRFITSGIAPGRTEFSTPNVVIWLSISAFANAWDCWLTCPFNPSICFCNSAFCDSISFLCFLTRSSIRLCNSALVASLPLPSDSLSAASSSRRDLISSRSTSLYRSLIVLYSAGSTSLNFSSSSSRSFCSFLLFSLNSFSRSAGTAPSTCSRYFLDASSSTYSSRFVSGTSSRESSSYLSAIPIFNAKKRSLPKQKTAASFRDIRRSLFAARFTSALFLSPSQAFSCAPRFYPPHPGTTVESPNQSRNRRPLLELSRDICSFASMHQEPYTPRIP